MDEEEVKITITESGGHSIPRLVVVAVNAAVYVMMFIWNNYVMYTQVDFKEQIGRGEPMNMTNSSSIIDIPPHPVVNILWIFMYIWNLSWVLYSVAIIFKKRDIGYLYCSPDGGIIPMTTYICFMFGLIFLRLHLGPWNQHKEILSTVFLLVAGLFILAALTFSGWRSYRIQEALEKIFLDKHLWAVRLLCQNGLGIIASWTVTCAVLFDLNRVLIIYGNLAPDVSSSICIAILALLFLVFAGCSLIPYGKYNVHTISPYCVFLYVLGCVIQRNWKYGDRNAIMIAILICFTAAALLLKLARIGLGLLKYCFEDRYVKRYWKYKT